MYDYSGYGGVETTTTSAFGIIGASFIILSLISMAVGIFMIICQWKVYKKCGKEGWECLIPIYNIIVLLEITGLPTWYIILFLIPFANIYAIFKLYIELARKLGKSTMFGVGLVFLPIIFFPILAFEKNNVGSMEPQPMEPQPMGPQPMEPQPMEPQPMNSQPIEPQPMNSQPIEPQPMNSQPIEPQPMGPQPMEPQPMEPQPMEPQPMKSNICPNCGNMVQESALFCTSCGNKL